MQPFRCRGTHRDSPPLVRRQNRKTRAGDRPAASVGQTWSKGPGLERAVAPQAPGQGLLPRGHHRPRGCFLGDADTMRHPERGEARLGLGAWEQTGAACRPPSWGILGQPAPAGLGAGGFSGNGRNTVPGSSSPVTAGQGSRRRGWT